MNKSVFIIYSGDDWNKKIPETGSVTTASALAEWCEFGLKHQLKVFRSEINWYDREKKYFRKAWTSVGGKWEKIDKPIQPDLIFDKTDGAQGAKLQELKLEISQKIRIFNHPLFRSLLGSKAAQYLCLGEFMPASFIASSQRELKEALSQLHSGQVVVKPLFGSGGFGILIDGPLDILKQDVSFPVLVQEFKENTRGVPGISKKPGLADLRLIYSNQELIYALTRMAKPNSLFTNLHQGAKAEKVSLAVIPEAVLKIAEKINQRLTFFPYSLFTLDFIFDDNGRPWLMELNTSPGLDIIYLTGTPQEREKFFTDTVLKNLI